MITTPPPALITYPIEADRFGPDERWPKRNSIIIFPGGDHRADTVWRVAKVESRRDYCPSIYLVPVDEVPDDGKSGQARIHYGLRSRYFSDSVGRLAKAGARIVVLDTVGKDFVDQARIRQAREAIKAEEQRAAYHVAPSGGVADRLDRQAQNVRYYRGEGRTVFHYVDELEKELPLLGEDDELTQAIAALRQVGTEIQAQEAKLAGIAEHLQSIVNNLRKEQE